jgi:hypothetical protein
VRHDTPAPTTPGKDELQQQQHRRAASVDDKSGAAAPGSSSSIGQQAAAQQAAAAAPTRAEWLLEKCLDLLLVLAHTDSIVKGLMCSKDNLQHVLDLTQRLSMPGLLKVRAAEWGVLLAMWSTCYGCGCCACACVFMCVTLMLLLLLLLLLRA